MEFFLFRLGLIPILLNRFLQDAWDFTKPGDEYLVFLCYNIHRCKQSNGGKHDQNDNGNFMFHVLLFAIHIKQWQQAIGVLIDDDLSIHRLVDV